MTRGSWFGLLLLLAVIAVVAGYWSGGGAPLPQELADATSAAGTDRAASELQSAEPVAANDRQLIEPAADDVGRDRVTTGTAPGTTNVRLRGRCIDPAGQPLAGVHVGVHGWPSSRNAVAEHESSYGEPVWEDPSIPDTGADGRFEVIAVLPDCFALSLTLEADGWMPMHGRWAAGSLATLDLGDLEFGRGAVVRGRVVDRDGRPIAPPPDATVRFSGGSTVLSMLMRRGQDVDAEPDLRAVKPRASAVVRIAADGTFETERPLRPSRSWWATLGGLRFASREVSQSVEVVLPETVLEFVALRPDELTTLTGRVVDDRGSPIEGATVLQAGQGARTDPRGRFTFVQPREDVDLDGQFALTVTAPGFDTLVTEESFGWDQTGVELALRGGTELVLRVVEDASGEPVERYAARTIGDRHHSSNPPIHDGLDHPGGVLRIVGVHRERTRVIVEPDDASDLALRTTVVDLGARSQEIEVRLREDVTQSIEVLNEGGRPVSGSLVELIDADGETLEADIPAGRLGFVSSSQSGWRVASAKTDTDGRVRLSAGRDLPLTLRILGDHAAYVAPIRPDGVDRTIEVRSGTTLRVEFRPAQVVATWIAMAANSDRRVRIRLQNEDGRFPHRTMAELGEVNADGTAELRGIPDGVWSLLVDRPVGSAWVPLALADSVWLHDGEIRELDIDVSTERLGTCLGKLVVDGEPYTGRFRLVRDLDIAVSGQPAIDHRSVVADRNGAFATLLPNGIWYAEVHVAVADGRSITLRSQNLHTQPPHAQSTPTFVVATGRQRVRVVLPDGSPAAGIRLAWSQGDARILRPVGEPTDENGDATILGQPGRYELSTTVRSLRDADAERARYREVLEAAGGRFEVAADQMAKLRVRLGPIELTATGSDDPVELRLPPEWDR